MKRPANKRDRAEFNIAGCAVVLACSDPDLLVKIKRSLSEYAARPDETGGSPRIALEVQAARKAWSAFRRMRPGGGSVLALDGSTEYQATVNLRTGRGRVILTSSAGMEALFNLVRRIIALLLIDRRGALFHCACVVRRKRAFLFFGKSGAGKTTVCSLCEGDRIASDDLTAVRIINGRILAWGLPSGFEFKAMRAGNAPIPVSAACKLVKDSSIFARRLSPALAAAAMLAFPSDLRDPRQTAKIVDLAADIVQNVPCFELHFRKDRSFWPQLESVAL